MNYSILVLVISFVIFLVIRVIVIHLQNRSNKKKEKFFTYSEVIDILIDSATFMAGVIALALALGFDVELMGKDIAYTQPLINYLAGFVLIFSAFRHLFVGGKK